MAGAKGGHRWHSECLKEGGGGGGREGLSWAGLLPHSWLASVSVLALCLSLLKLGFSQGSDDCSEMGPSWSTELHPSL